MRQVIVCPYPSALPEEGGATHSCECGLRELKNESPRISWRQSNAWLKAQGLVSVKALWSKAQGYTN